MSTIEAVIDHFHDADICVGIHGAGLANCVLVRGAKKKNLIYMFVISCIVDSCLLVPAGKPWSDCRGAADISWVWDH